MQDIIDTEPEEILIIGNTHSPARLGKGIRQIPLDRTVRIRNRRIIKVTPITSGDTAFRSARLTLADWFKIDQDSYANRLKLCIPVLGVGTFLGIGNALGFINYTVIWRYFSWTNQTLAMIVLWAASMYLFKEKKNFWITAVPATFMSAVSSTYFVLAPECLGGLLNSKTAEGATIYNTAVAYPVGVLFAVAMLAIFIHATKKSAAKA